MRRQLSSRAPAFLAVLLLIAPVLASGVAHAQTTRNTGLQLTGDKPVQIEGDELEVLEDKSVAVFTGNVSVVQGPTVLRTGKLTIHYLKDGAGGAMTSSSSEIERLEATGGVNIQSGTQVATGDTGVFDMQTQVLVLSGKRVTLSQDGNVATGCKLTVAMKSGRATLQGCGDTGSRPTILLQPRSARDN